jgi:hypothetical protein
MQKLHDFVLDVPDPIEIPCVPPRAFIKHGLSDRVRIAYRYSPDSGAYPHTSF